jgi:hypothetical protein
MKESTFGKGLHGLRRQIQCLSQTQTEIGDPVIMFIGIAVPLGNGISKGYNRIDVAFRKFTAVFLSLRCDAWIREYKTSMMIHK